MAIKEVLLNKNFILDQNDELILKLENYIKCPRCKNNLRCYRRKILTLDKEECKNVCNHCLNEYLFRKPSTSREKDKRTIGRDYSPVKYNKDKVKLWLSRIIDLLESNLILYKTANLSKQAERKALMSTKSRYKFHEPELGQMFDSTQRKEKPEEIIKSIKREIRYADDDIDNTDTHDKRQFGKKSDDISSVDTFRDDFTNSSTDSHLKQPAMLQEKLQVLKKIIFRESEDQDTKKSFDENYKRVSTAKRRNFDYKQKDVRMLPRYVSSETKIQNVRKHLSITSLKRFNSLDTLTSLSGLTEKTLEQNFSYFFPREERDQKPVRHQKSSSEIIKDTIDMLSERAELEKEKRNKERRKKIEEKENKRLARLEKLKQKFASEIKVAEDTKEVTYSTEVNDKMEKETIPLKSIKSAKVNQKSTQLENIKKTQSLELESKKGKDKIKKEGVVKKINKDKEMSVKEEPKKVMEKPTKGESKKDRDKSSKEDLKKQRLAEKEQKMKVKDEKEKKLQEKAEKEERLRLEKEEKKKLKYEYLKKEKEEQLQREKERSQKETSTEVKEKNVKGEKVKEKTTTEKDDKKMQEMVERQLKEEAFSKMAIEEQQMEKSAVSPKPKKVEQTTFKELNISQVKLRKHSQDNLILQLVKLKQSEKKEPRERPKRLSEINVSPIIFRAHKNHAALQDSCILCSDSELELDVDNILFGERKLNEPIDIIMGQKIVKVIKSPRINKKDTTNIMFEPSMFKSTFLDENSLKKSESDEVKGAQKKPSPPASKRIDPEATKGIIRYALSDRSFIDKGWTMLPTEKVVRKMNVYRMRPAHPEFDWFEHNKNKKLMHYDTGEKLAEFDVDGKGRWFYRNGRLALDYYDAEETNAQQRFVIYSNGEPDERGRPRPFTILATFDYLGNGVVFDHSGKIRLKYNQTEGVVLDKSIGPVSHWKWHTLNDPPVLQQVMIDTQMSHKEPEILKLGGHGDQKPRQDNEEMLAIEFDNFIKEKSKKLTQKFKPFQIKMKALKINENFSLKVLDQATVYLIFRDGSTNLKLNIGMILDHKEIVDTDTAEVGEVSNSLERFPAKTDSLAGLQHSVAHAQCVERARLERERRLRPSRSHTSADKLTAATSKPLRPPFRSSAIPSNTSNTTATTCHCKYRKPSSCNIYYDTRLV